LKSIRKAQEKKITKMLSLEFMRKAQKKKTHRALLGVNAQSSQRKGTCRALCTKFKIEEPLEDKTYQAVEGTVQRKNY
jgi:hypothetical protein